MPTRHSTPPRAVLLLLATLAAAPAAHAQTPAASAAPGAPQQRTEAYQRSAVAELRFAWRDIGEGRAVSALVAVRRALDATIEVTANEDRALSSSPSADAAFRAGDRLVEAAQALRHDRLDEASALISTALADLGAAPPQR